MNKCTNCSKFGFCKKASEEIKDCSNFEKRHYDTKLVKIEDGTYYFEEIK